MPKIGGSYQGNFDSYEAGGGGEFPDDEDAIASACDEMFSMCGNAGQEALIGDYLADFEDWALAVLEAEGGGEDTWGAFATMVSEDWYEGEMDKWDGTYLIWRTGYDTVASMFGFHDSYDEQGEGVGR